MPQCATYKYKCFSFKNFSRKQFLPSDKNCFANTFLLYVFKVIRYVYTLGMFWQSPAYISVWTRVFDLVCVSLLKLVANPCKCRFLSTDQRKFAVSACEVFTRWRVFSFAYKLARCGSLCQTFCFFFAFVFILNKYAKPNTKAKNIWTFTSAVFACPNRTNARASG